MWIESMYAAFISFQVFMCFSLGQVLSYFHLITARVVSGEAELKLCSVFLGVLWTLQVLSFVYCVFFTFISLGIFSYPCICTFDFVMSLYHVTSPIRVHCCYCCTATALSSNTKRSSDKISNEITFLNRSENFLAAEALIFVFGTYGCMEDMKLFSHSEYSCQTHILIFFFAYNFSINILLQLGTNPVKSSIQTKASKRT